MGNFSLPIKPPETVSGIVAGKKSGGGGHDIPVFYPATGNQVSTLIEDSPESVHAAVLAARKAFDNGPWPKMPLQNRIQALQSCGDLIAQNKDELARLECVATGLVMRELVERHIPRAAYNFKFFAEYVNQACGQRYDQTTGFLTTVTRMPVGVAALIAPWNAPLALATMKIAAALAFGNCCVVKPSEQTPFSLVKLVLLLQEILPEGVLNLINGRGAVTGAALVANQDIDLVSFTGGTETGRHVMSAAGKNLVPCTMELGGKSANIILSSADLERALDGALLGIFSNNGQQCLAGSRILLERSIYEDFIEKFVERTKKIKVGDPLDNSTEIGPLASKEHMKRVLTFAETARKEGGTILVGGDRRNDLGEGYFINPTAVKVLSNNTKVTQQEIFGPFASFIIFDTIQEAIEIANDTKFGLVSYVWSNHLPTVTTLSEELQSGVIWINTPMMRELRAPFGGIKQSGVGREGGGACEQFYTEEKVITLPKVENPIRKLGVS